MRNKRKEYDFAKSEKIMLDYLGLSEANRSRTIKSPFREDKKASLGIYRDKTGKLRYKDFGTGEYGDSIDFCRKIGRKIEIKKEDARKEEEEMKKLNTDGKQERIIRYREREFSKKDKEYWEESGATDYKIDECIKRGLLKSAQRLIFFTGKKITGVLECEEYAYLLFCKRQENFPGQSEQEEFKLYQPKSKKRKWINKIKGDELFFWDMLPDRGEQVIITSSFKDALCLMSQIEIPAIAPQGEGMTLKKDKIEELERRFKEIYIIYDNDEAGRKNAERVTKEFPKTTIVEIPKIMGAKDPSELYKAVGEEMFYDIMNYLL